MPAVPTMTSVNAFHLTPPRCPRCVVALSRRRSPGHVRGHECDDDTCGSVVEHITRGVPGDRRPPQPIVRGNRDRRQPASSAERDGAVLVGAVHAPTLRRSDAQSPGQHARSPARIDAVPDFDELVEQLAVPHRHKDARRALMTAGRSATPALRRGLRHDSADVRRACCQVLDHFLDEDAIPELLENLRHDDASVRTWAVHALACERCKEGACRPGEEDVVPIVISLLLDDPARQVRAQAAHLLAGSIHRRADAVEAMTRAHADDADPGVRKIAGWWVPGGVRYERTKPKVGRVRPGNG